MLRDIDKQEHKDIHAVFEKYGWSREEQAVNLSEAENQSAPKVDKERLQELKDRLPTSKDEAEAQEKSESEEREAQSETQGEYNHKEEHSHER